MNKSIEKFIKLIEEGNKFYERNLFILKNQDDPNSKREASKIVDILINRRMFVDQLNRIINCDLSDKETFNNFDGLSTLLDSNRLKLKEKFDIILALVERNIKLGFLNIQGYYISLDVVKKYKFTKSSLEEVLKFIRSERFTNLKAEDELTEKEKAIIDEMTEITRLSTEYLKPTVEGHKILDKYLLSKLPDIKKEDIPFIMEGFTKIEITENILKELEIYLNSLVNKKKDVDNTQVKNNYQSRTMLSNKELRKLNKELSNYYDFESNKIIKALSLDEELYVIYLMQKLNFSKDKIEAILSNYEKMIPFNPIVLYVKLHDKYKNTRESEEILKELEGYFQNMFICDEEEYAINKMCFIDTFNKFLDSIPHNYDYEFSKAKELKR